MNEELVTYAELRQFLLGNVDDKERQRIESLFVSNSLLRERVLAAEQDLIEEYLENSLNTADKEKFLAQYAETPAQRQKLRIAKSIKDWAIAQSGAAKVSVWNRLRGRLRLKPMFVIPIAATAMVAIIVGGIWLNSRIQQRNERLGLEQEVAQLNRLHEVPSQMAPLFLRPGSVRSAEPQNELVRCPDLQVVELRLLWPQKERFPSYEVVVHRVGDNQPITIHELHAVSDTIPIKLPAHSLTRGLYQIELTGIGADGSRSPAEEYNFTVSG